ncbi:hypothetical protein [Enterococcus timonensis]|uniref:hypothetical protein n=1 Tax=Enterococcus timonensis TaxID=1852364 RepID=UPI001319EBDF|nr:hypothetical protein [Enterococcus timonensis]
MTAKQSGSIVSIFLAIVQNTPSITTSKNLTKIHSKLFGVDLFFSWRSLLFISRRKPFFFIPWRSQSALFPVPTF